MFRFAIAGCGFIASQHAESIKKIGSIAAVCDVVKERADQLAASTGATAYYSVDDLLQSGKEMDIIVICTPNGFHAEHIIKSLQAGFHVLCEQPLCLTPAAAWQIIETEKFTRKKLFMVQPVRYNAIIQQLHERIQSEKLGRVYSFSLDCLWNRPPSFYTDWHGKQFPDGGTLYTQFSAFIDALIWLLGELDTAKGLAANKAHEGVMEFEDTGVAALQMKSGALGTLHWSVNTFEKDTEINLTIVAERGTPSIGGPYLNRLQYEQVPHTIRVSGPAPSDTIDNEYRNTGAGNRDGIYKNLLAGPSLPLSNAFDGLKTVEAIDKIYKALHTSAQL